ncbi:hypothetical protein YPPY13_0970, partial [Yersinia pestis PY-13]
MLVTFPVIR